MSIDLLNETNFPVDLEELHDCAAFVLHEMRVYSDVELYIGVIDEAAMETLHVQWMELPGPTDVLSFPMDELRSGNIVEGVLGDIVVCPTVAAKQAAEAGHTIAEELLLLTVHGILHLLGCDHAEPDERKEMFELQRTLLLTFLAERSHIGVDVSITPPSGE